MKVFVGHRSALQYLRSLSAISELKRTESRPRPGAAPSADELRAALGIVGIEAKRLPCGKGSYLLAPIDLVVADGKSRRARSFIHSHVWQSPEKALSFLKLEDDLYVSGPEACFVQMGKFFDVVQLAQIGFELCGSYSRSKKENIGFFARKPLTSRKRIAAYLKKLPPGSGVDKAAKALEFVRDCSASPMETCLALLLGLPVKMGGYGLGVPALNVEVKAPSGIRSKATWHTYHCDLFWEESKVAIEYNSTLFHSGEEAIFHDSERMNDLVSFGYNVLTVTRPQIANPDRMDVVAEIVAKMMGHRIRPRLTDWQVRKMQLRRTLFDPDEFF